MRRTVAARVRTVVVSLSAGVRPALLIGSWLALTFLFVFVGVVLVGNAVSALGLSRGPASFVLIIVGVLSACGLSPTLAQATVVAAVERVEAVFDRDGDTEPDGWLFSLCDLKERAYCRTSSECCC